MTISRFSNHVLFILIFTLVGLLGFESYGQSPSCTFACNDTINVSVDRLCQATITADMVLEGYDVADCGVAPNPVIYDANDRRINSRVLTRQYIGQYLKVEISNSTQGKCWGYIHLEDKLPPEIVCPENDTIRCDATDYANTNASLEARLKTQLESTLIDNCGDEELQIVVLTNSLSTACSDPFSAQRSITFVALDNFANADTCSYSIFYESVAPAEIDPPMNYTDVDALECDDSFPLKDGLPYPTVEYLMTLDGNRSMPNIDGQPLATLLEGAFVSENLCNFKIGYSDQLFPSCGGSYKIVRNWAVIDWCNINDPMNFYQVIKVVDHELLITDCPNNMTLAAAPSSCTIVGSLLRPTISSTECSNWTWGFAVQEPGETDFTTIRTNISSGASSTNYEFALGVSTVLYTVIDECGNEDTCRFTVTVEDQDEPMAVCDQRTVVTLNSEFKAKVFALSFNDGSFDACSDISYQVRRMDGSCNTSTIFGDFVQFCCEDLGKSILVELRVTDESGLFSSCMAEAIVQYDGELIDVTCPANPSIRDCRTFDGFNPNTLTRPTITTLSSCITGLTPVPTVTNEDINECGVGFKDVAWTINFNGADTVICTNRVEFRNLDLFIESDINWPSNRTISSCDDLAATASELNNLIPSNVACGNVIYSEPQDRVFDELASTCVKVLRTWTVVDWCQYPDNPNAIWTHVQTIIVERSDDPEFNSAVASVDVTYGDNCSASTKLTPMASDDCTSDKDLVWTYQLDIVSGTSTLSIIPLTSGRVINTQLDQGNYRATWTVEDKCGNITEASKDFSINDIDDPAAQCQDRQINISSFTETALVNVSEVNNGSTDNCDGGNLQMGLRRAGTNDALVNTLTFTCDDVGDVLVELVVEDQNGNTDACISTITVVDPESVCDEGAFNLGLPCGHVMDFDGTDDYIDIPSLDITDEFTIEAMVYFQGSGTAGQYISLFEFGNDNPFIGFDNGDLTIFGQIIDDETFPVETWTHLAVTYSPSTNRSAIYMNGQLSKVGAATSTFIGSGFGIAHHDGDEPYFRGKLDEVRVWDQARTAGQILLNANTTVDAQSDGLVAYYDFNAVAAVLIDKTNNGHNGTLSGLDGDNALPFYEEVDTPCPPDNSGASASILVSGSIYTPDLISIEKANMSIQRVSSAEMKYSNSDVSGTYAFSNMPSYEKYELAADKRDDYDNGVTTLDLIMIQQHVLGIRLLDTPYKLIAADASNNGSISSIDLVLLRQLILGIIDELPQNASWRFVGKDHVFDNPTAPWYFDESIELTLTEQTAEKNDFIGIKIGDVNGSAIANSALASVRSNETINLLIDRKYVDGQWRLDFTTDENLDLSGMQFELAIDDFDLTYADMVNGVLSLDSDAYSISEESIKVSWINENHTAIPNGDILFSLMLNGDSQIVPIPNFSVMSTDYNQAYDTEYNVYGLNLSLSEGEEMTGTEFIVYQNIPNPFSETTNIYFEIANDAEVTLEIYSVNGEMKMAKTDRFKKGMNQITVNKSNAQLNKGIYYYQIKTQNRSLVRKMIVI